MTSMAQIMRYIQDALEYYPITVPRFLQLIVLLKVNSTVLTLTIEDPGK